MANCSVQKAIARMNKQYTPIPCALYSELDIDSHQLSPFTDDDEAFLTTICEWVAPLL